MSKQLLSRTILATVGTAMAALAFASAPKGSLNSPQPRNIAEKAVAFVDPDPAAAEPNKSRSPQGDSEEVPNASAATTRGTHDADRHMRKQLRMANQDEIALAQLAQQRSSNEGVKKFATQMIDDHTKFLGRLQTADTGASPVPEGSSVPNQEGAKPAAADANSTEKPPAKSSENGDAQSDGENQPKVNRVNAVEIEGQNGARSKSERDVSEKHGQHGGPHAFLRIMDEVAQQCQQSLTRELSQKEGPQFDRGYMNSQVLAHMKIADMIAVFEKHASTELQPVLKEAQQTTKEHLAHAKRILSEIEDPSVKASTTNPSTPDAK